MPVRLQQAFKSIASLITNDIQDITGFITRTLT